MEYKCLLCNKDCQRKSNKNLKEQFFNKYKFPNRNNNKFILLLLKAVYRYKYMDDWKKFNETSLLEKEGFYSHLKVEEVTDADYAHEKSL